LGIELPGEIRFAHKKKNLLEVAPNSARLKLSGMTGKQMRSVKIHLTSTTTDWGIQEWRADGSAKMGLKSHVPMLDINIGRPEGQPGQPLGKCSSKLQDKRNTKGPKMIEMRIGKEDPWGGVGSSA